MEQRRGSLLVQGLDDAVHGVSMHPYLPQLALTSYSGAVHVWDYDTKQLLLVRLLNPATDRPQCVAFDVQGRFLAVGTTSGRVLILDPHVLTDTQKPLSHGSGTIVDIKFSSDGIFMATADSDRYVALYRFMPTPVPKSMAGGGLGKTTKPWEAAAEAEAEEEAVVDQWVYIGRIRSHSRPITGLSFGMSGDGLPLLASVGEDRRLVQYDLMASSVLAGVVVDGERTRVEQTAVPTCCIWYPLGSISGTDPREHLVLSASDEYKFKLWNSTSRACRATKLSPTFGGPVNNMVHVPRAPSGAVGAAEDEEHGSRHDLLAYSTADRVVGLVLLPLDGNPRRSMGLVAHPRKVASICASRDGAFLATCGGDDCTVNLWRVKPHVLDTIATADTGVDPYVALLDGGAEGDAYKEIQDLFIFSQIRSQGEDTMSPRICGDRMPLSEVPNFMRAIGFYPTEYELQTLVDEVRYSNFTRTGVEVDSVSLDEAVRLYVNHRPVLGIGKAAIQDALGVIAARMEGGVADDGKISWRSVVEMLTGAGEAMSPEEVDDCLRALTGEALNPDKLNGNEFVGAAEVAQDLLGFEDY